MMSQTAQEIAKQLSLSPNAADRAELVRQWLDAQPDADAIASLYKEYSHRDKGVARQLKERQEAIKRTRQQAALTAEWAAKAQSLLQQQRLAIADILAWQRDTARMGAPLAHEPLASLRTALQARLLGVEDLHTQIQVHKEAAVLLAQRIEIQANKGWSQVREIFQTLLADVQSWQAKTRAIQAHDLWGGIELRMEPMLENAKEQLLAVWQAFSAAYDSADKASKDNQAPLPKVTAWAADIEAQRVAAIQEDLAQKKQLSAEQRLALQAKLKARREQSVAAVQPLLRKLEQELNLGHGKASIEAAQKLREALRVHESALEASMAAHAHSALAAAGELGDWQRWRADQLRIELIQKAEKLKVQALAPAKQQEQLRQLREHWKTTDQGGQPNHSLWRQFDSICNEAHKVVEAWIEQQKSLANEHCAQRQALIAEVRAFGAAQTQGDHAGEHPKDYWKAQLRSQQQFIKRWHNSGRVAEKVWGELNSAFRHAMDTTFAALNAASTTSVELRSQLIEQAQQLGLDALASIDQVRALQEQWKTQAQRMPLERHQEQRLWDQFRQALDAVFAAKDEVRKQQRAAQQAAEKPTLDAIATVAAATAAGDAQAIQHALQQLDAALHGVPNVASPTATALAEAPSNATPPPAAEAATAPAASGAPSVATATAACSDDHSHASGDVSAAPGFHVASGSEAPAANNSSATPAPEAPQAVAVPRRVVAVRGDDRPPAQKFASALLAQAKAGGRNKSEAKPMHGDRRHEGRSHHGHSSDRLAQATRPGAGDRGAQSGARNDQRAERSEQRSGWTERVADRDERLRLSRDTLDAARQARACAQKQLRALAAQAHGASVSQVLQAWHSRDSALLPRPVEAGRLAPALPTWTKALAQNSKGVQTAAQEALLQLEIATELPSPAAYQAARRMLQLKMLTQRGGPDAHAWQQQVAHVLQSPHNEESATRLLAILKTLAQGPQGRHSA